MYRNTDKNRAYMKQYMLNRYRQRLANAMYYLGGKCIKCGSTKDLQFDHLDPREKTFTIAKLWSLSQDRFWLEARKCQLLCRTCHQEKTLNDLGQVSAKTTHGTLSSYRYCKCELCKKANSNWSRDYKRKRRSASLMAKAPPF